MAKRQFGVEVSFKGDQMTLEQLFGSKPIMSTQITKVIWEHIREGKKKEYMAIIATQKDWKPKVGDKVKAESSNKKWYVCSITKVNGGGKITVMDDQGVFTVNRNQLFKL